MLDFAQFLQDSNLKLRAGQIEPVAEQLQKLSFREIPRRFYSQVGNLAWRSGASAFGLRLLHSVIRSEKAVAQGPSPAEIAEYAVLLHRSGSHNEAFDLLGDPKLRSLPEAHLYRAFVQFGFWDANAAASEIKSYMAGPLSEYQRAVAQTNLAAAYVLKQEYPEASELLKELKSVCQSNQFQRLLGNAHEIEAQLYFQMKEFGKCRQSVDSALRILGGSNSQDYFFAIKWRAALEAVEAKSIEPLKRMRIEAKRREEWESVRDLDRLMLDIHFEQKRFDFLYTGTPYQQYRERLSKQFNVRPQHQFFVRGAGEAQLYDLSDGTFQRDGVLEPPPKSGQVFHQLLRVLFKDFYRPLRYGEIFAELFPGEYFNPISTPNRIIKTVSRAKGFLKKEEIDINIVSRGLAFIAMPGDSMKVRVPVQLVRVDGHFATLNRIEQIFADREFSSREAEAQLDIKRSTLQIFTKWALGEGFLKTLGPPNRVRYQLVKKE